MAVAWAPPQGRTLIGLGVDYLDFLDRAGQTTDKGTIEQEVPSLCARECVKIVNTDPVWEVSTEFADQLLKAHDFYGNWRINKDYRVIPSPSTHTVSVKYTAETQQARLLAMAFLDVNGAGLITKIDEVYTPLKTGEKK